MKQIFKGKKFIGMVDSFSLKKKGICFGLLLVYIFSSMPLLQGALIGISDANGYEIDYSYSIDLRAFLFLFNLATLLISFYSFKILFENDYIGLLCAMLYELSVYRVSAEYITGYLGETVAMAFLPLLLLGFYEIFFGKHKEIPGKYSWISLCVGIVGLVLSQLLVGIFDFPNTSMQTIQSRGLLVADLLFVFFRSGNQLNHSTEGMLYSEPMGFGLALVSAFIIWCLMRFLGKFKYLSKSDLRFGKISAWVMVSFSVMSLSAFPWDRIQQLNKLMSALVSSIRYPKRFLVVATLAGIALVGLLAKEFSLVAKGSLKRKYIYKGFDVGMLLGVFCSGIYLINDIAYSEESYIIIDVCGAMNRIGYRKVLSAIMVFLCIALMAVCVIEKRRKYIECDKEI